MSALTQEPSKAQAEAGNYRKLHLSVQGLRLSIENEKGSTRSGKGSDGKAWHVTMPAHYGYIKGTEGADGDHVDVYIGPHLGNPFVYVVDQVDADTGKFDEHKAMLGFSSKRGALETYKQGFSDGKGPDRIGHVSRMTVSEFKAWLDKGARKKPASSLKSMTVDRTHDNSELAGESEDQTCLYLDRHIPKKMTIKGKSFDPAKYLAIHETDERKHMDAGMKYQMAHRLALKVERNAVEADGIDWNGYQDQMHALARITNKLPWKDAPAKMHREVPAYAEGGPVTSAVTDEDDEDQDTSGPWSEYQDTAGPWDDYKTEYSAPVEAAKRVGKAILPGLGALPAMAAGAGAGAKAGAGLGSMIAPGPGTAIGGVVGGIAGAGLAGFAAGTSLRHLEELILNKLGINADPEKEAAFEEEHPNLATAADIAGSMAGMSPARGAVTLGTRALMGAGQAGLEAASQKIQGQDLDPTKLAMAGAAGVAFPGLNRVGRPLWARGERAIGAPGAPPPPGRPDMRPEEASSQEAPDSDWLPDFQGSEPIDQGREYPREAPIDERYPDTGPWSEYQEDAGHGFPEDMNHTVTQDNGPRTPPGPAQPPGYQIGKPYRNTVAANENVAGQTRPGTSPPENVAPAPGAEGTFAPGRKTAEFLKQSKQDAAPARNQGGTLGTAQVQAPPDKTVGTVGSNPDHPLSVGSERDYRGAGATKPPTATIGDPARGNISPEIELALTGKHPDENMTPAGGAPTQEELHGGPETRTPIGPAVPPVKDTGIEQAAVTDTVTKLRGHGLDQVADIVEQNPAAEPQVRRILQDLTAEPIEGMPVDAEKARAARRRMEQANSPEEQAAAKALMEEAQNPLAKDQREAAAVEQTKANATRRETEGQVAQVGDQTVTAASQRKAALIKRAADAAQSAFNKYATGKIGATDYSELSARLRDAIAHAKTENMDVHALSPLPRKRTSAQEWLKAAQDLVGTPENPKTIRPSKAVKFLGDERMLLNGAKAKEVGEFSKIEGEIAKNKRRVTTDPVDTGVKEWLNGLSQEDRGAWEKEFGHVEGRDPGEADTEHWADTVGPTAGKKPDLEYYNRAEQFWTNEDGSFNPQRFIQDFKGFFGKKNQGAARRFSAKNQGGYRAEYAASIGDQLNQVRKMDDTNWLDREREAATQHPLLKANAEAVYLAHERDDIASLPADVRAAYQQHLAPIFEHNDWLYDQIHALNPKILGTKVIGHITRIAKGLHPDFGGDPVANVMATRRRGLKLSASQTMQREFMVIEDPSGNRTVVSESPEGYREWNNYHSQERQNANFEMEPGTTFTDYNNRLMTVKDALTPEIEAHAKFKNGEKATYYKNAIMSAYITNAEMRGILSHLQYLESLKPQLRSERLATPDAAQAKEWAKVGEPWSKTVLPQMDGWYATPRLREVLDDYAAPGLTTGEAWDKIRGLSEVTTKLLFLNPVFHLANVGTHWFVGKGWDWVKPHQYRDEIVTSVNAIRSVLSQDSAIAGSPFGKMLGFDSPNLRRFQDVLREHGTGLQFAGVLNQNRWHNIAKAAGETIASNPSKWDPIAAATGILRADGKRISAADLGRAIYRTSSKIMWAGNDMFLTQQVMMNLKKGMSMHEAIVATEQHFPNYRVPSRVIGSKAWGRWTSQALRDNTLFAFGPYHYGVFNSYAHIVKDAVHPDSTPAERLDAAGKMFAMGLLAFAVYPAMDAAVKVLTGNKDATQRRRGPVALPDHIMRAMQGKGEDLLNVAPTMALTPSPLLGGTWNLAHNRDFAGRPFVEPGDVTEIAKGPHRVRAAGKVAVQGAAAAAKTYIAPYAMASKALENRSGSALGSVRDQLMDIKDPSPAATKYEQQAAEIKRKGAEARARKGNRNWEENVYNRLTK